MVRDLDLMNGLLNGIENSESWCKAMVNDPAIKAADKAFYAALDRIRGTVDGSIVEMIDNAATAYASAICTVSTLYGIHIMYTLRECANDPAMVSRYLLSRRRVEHGLNAQEV